MNDLSSALERLRVAFSTPTPGLGASSPAEDDERCGHHGAGYSTDEEAEGLRGGLPEDHAR